MMSEGFSALPQAAVEFARAHHEGQRRDADDQPFVLHPLEVATLLRDAGAEDHVVAAGALHDVLEDTEVQQHELRERFGSQVAELVGELTDDPAIPDVGDRRAALRRQVANAGPEAATVFAADKISKSRELRFKADHGALTDDDRAKIEHYRESCRMLHEKIPGHILLELLSYELAGLRKTAAG
jgi:(p)ppGpp synthase/HD superfamily hydrolase